MVLDAEAAVAVQHIDMVAQFHGVDFFPQVGYAGGRVFEREDLDGDDAIGGLVSPLVHLRERSLEWRGRKRRTRPMMPIRS